MSKWFKFPARKPINGKRVWIYGLGIEDGLVGEWCADIQKWVSSHPGAYEVTHWMTLPSPPQKLELDEYQDIDRMFLPGHMDKVSNNYGSGRSDR